MEKDVAFIMPYIPLNTTLLCGGSIGLRQISSTNNSASLNVSSTTQDDIQNISQEQWEKSLDEIMRL